MAPEPLARTMLGELVPVVDRLAVDRDDLVTRAGSRLRLAGAIGSAFAPVRQARSPSLAGITQSDTWSTVRVGSLHPEAHEDGAEQEDGQEDVHHRPAGHDDDLLPPGLAVEEPVLVLVLDRARTRPRGRRRSACRRSRPVMPDDPAVGAALGRRQHPDHPDEAAHRDRLDAVLGVALSGSTRPSCRSRRSTASPSRRTSSPVPCARPRAGRSTPMTPSRKSTTPSV